MTKQDVRTTLWQSLPAKVTLEVEDFARQVLGIHRNSSGWIVFIPKIYTYNIQIYYAVDSLQSSTHI